MNFQRRGKLVSGLLIGIWVLIAAWQLQEHLRVVAATRRARLIDHAKDISDTLGVVIRSQQWRGGVIKERIESALHSLVKAEDLVAIALLNDSGEVIASANWENGAATPRETITLTNLVELGTNAVHELEQENPTIIIPINEITNRGSRMFPRPPGPPPDTNTPSEMKDGDHEPPPRMDDSGPPSEQRRGRRRGDGRPPRPSWMGEDEYKAILQKQGIHAFALILSTRTFQSEVRADLWMRTLIMLLTTVSVIGSGLAWRSVSNSSDLQFRLVRASEMNSHLKEMNLAAAGLAHETRNPLNIIRGMAQMISKHQGATEEIRNQSRSIVDETDKVTAQLNEFINYSRPRELRRIKLALKPAAAEVLRTLGHDLEEKKISCEVIGDPVTVEADEQLLRQTLFNLVLNAIQAVDNGGRIEVRVVRSDASQAALEVRDDGPGVAPENRQEIFKPYFTTHQKGTGLGLAVVHQSVLMHGWEIQCLPNSPKGALFRITHLKIVS